MVTHIQLHMLPDFVHPQKRTMASQNARLAVIYCLEHFRDIILGYKITVWTDRTAIRNLFKHKNLRGRFARLVCDTTEL